MLSLLGEMGRDPREFGVQKLVEMIRLARLRRPVLISETLWAGYS